MYPDAIIFIGDDGEISCKDYFKNHFSEYNINVFDLPNDSGLSFGRNYLLDRVKTDYFVLLDDDVVFDKMTDLEAGLSILKRENLDIIGGYFRNNSIVYKYTDNIKVLIREIFRLEKPYNYIGNLHFDAVKKVLYVNLKTKEFPDFTITDITHNFFIGRTKIIREKNRWDDELKINEHTAFFLNGKKVGLRVGFTNKMSVIHKPIRTKKYLELRSRDFFQLFMKKYNINKTVFSNNGNVFREEHVRNVQELRPSTLPN